MTHTLHSFNAAFTVETDAGIITGIDSPDVPDIAAFRRSVIGTPYRAWRARLTQKNRVTVRGRQSRDKYYAREGIRK